MNDILIDLIIHTDGDLSSGFSIASDLDEFHLQNNMTGIIQ